jgi:hypothetical protein
MEKKIDQDFNNFYQHAEDPSKTTQISCKSLKSSSKKHSNPQTFKSIRIKIKNKNSKTKAKLAEGRHQSISTSPLRSNSKKGNIQDRGLTTTFSSPLNTVLSKDLKKKQLKAEKIEKNKSRVKKSIFEDPLHQMNSVSEMLSPDRNQKRRKSRSKEKDLRRLSVEGVKYSEVCRVKQGSGLDPSKREVSKEPKEKTLTQTFDVTKLKKTLKKSQKLEKKTKKVQDIQVFIREKKKNFLEKPRRLQDDLKEKERLARSKRKSKTRRIKERKNIPSHLESKKQNLSKSTRRNPIKSNEDQTIHNLYPTNLITSPVSRSSSESFISGGLRTEREEWINPWEFRNISSTSEFVEEFKAKMMKNQQRASKVMKSPESHQGLLKVIQSSESDSSEFGNLIEKPIQSFQKSNKPSIPPLSLSLLKHESDYDSCSEYYEPFVMQKESFENKKSEKSKENIYFEKIEGVEENQNNLKKKKDYFEYVGRESQESQDFEESQESEDEESQDDDYCESKSEKNTIWMIEVQQNLNEKMKKTFPSFKNLDFTKLGKFDETSDEPSHVQEEENIESNLSSMKSPRKHLRILSDGREKNTENVSGLIKKDFLKLEEGKNERKDESFKEPFLKTDEKLTETGKRDLEEKNLKKTPNENHHQNLDYQNGLSNPKVQKKTQKDEETVISEAPLTRSTETTVKSPTPKNSQEKTPESCWRVPVTSLNPINQNSKSQITQPAPNKSCLINIEKIPDLPKHSPSENMKPLEFLENHKKKLDILSNDDKKSLAFEKKTTFNTFLNNPKPSPSKESLKTEKNPFLTADLAEKVPVEEKLTPKLPKDLLKTTEFPVIHTKPQEKVNQEVLPKENEITKTIINKKDFLDFSKSPKSQIDDKTPKNLKNSFFPEKIPKPFTDKSPKDLPTKENNEEKHLQDQQNEKISKDLKIPSKINLKNEEKHLKDQQDEKISKDSKKPSQINTKNLIKPQNSQEEVKIKPISEEKYFLSSPSSSDSIFTPFEQFKITKVKADFLPDLQPTKEETREKKIRDVRNLIEKIDKNDSKINENSKQSFSQLAREISPILSFEQGIEEPVVSLKTEENSKDERISENSPHFYGILQTSIINPADLKSPELNNSNSSISINSPQSDKEKNLYSSSEISQKFITKFKDPPNNKKDLKLQSFSSKFLENSGDLSSDRAKKFSESTKNLIKSSKNIENFADKGNSSNSSVVFKNLETKIPVISESSQEISIKSPKISINLKNPEIKTEKLNLPEKEENFIISNSASLPDSRINKNEELKVNPLSADVVISENVVELNKKAIPDSSPKQTFTSDLFKSYNPYLDSSSSSDIIISNDSSPNLTPKDLLTQKSSKPSPLITEDLTDELSTIISSEIYAFLRVIPFKDQEKEVDPSLEFMIEYLNVMANELKENEAEVLEAINTPVYQDPMTRLCSLQDFSNQVLSKFPTLELILPPDLCSELKVRFESLEIPTRQIYLQMLFDCVNEALNYIRPFGVTGIPDPWSNHPRILFGEAELENVFNRVLGYMVKWASCKAGLFHSLELTVDEDKLSSLREEKMSALLCIDVKDEESTWLHYEEEETQSKIVSSQAILDLLLQETLQILNL